MTYEPYPSHTTTNPEVSDAALVIRNLYKNFPGKVAVNNLSLTVPKGSFFGIVGPNGAGKTTAILAATGIIRPDGGNSWSPATHCGPTLPKAHGRRRKCWRPSAATGC